MKLNIIIASDHAGFSLKQEIQNYFNKQFQLIDVGTYNEQSIDYPDLAEKAILEYHKKPHNSFGILICGTGIGMCITANKFQGIYCALIHDIYTAKMAKAHNQANFIALGSRIKYQESVETIIEEFIRTKNEKGRHENRVTKIKKIENLNKE